MPYATLEQLTTRYGEQLLLQLTDRAQPPAGAIDGDIVAQELGNTDATIDGFLAGRYALPLAGVPALLSDVALRIAIYKLHPYATDPKIEADYKAAIADLDHIAKGTIRLPVAGVEPQGAASSGVETIDRERDFTPENMRGLI